MSEKPQFKTLVSESSTERNRAKRLRKRLVLEKTKGGRRKMFSEAKKFVGTKYLPPESFGIIKVYGSPETLEGTNNSIWRAYFPRGNFTMEVDKSTDRIRKISSGKQGRTCQSSTNS